MQTKTESLIEQITKTSIKFCSAVAIWEFILAPLIRYDYVAYDDSFVITCVFTVNSFALGYIIRRYFNGRTKVNPNLEL